MSEEKKYKNLIVQGAVYKTTFTRKFEERINWEAPNENLIHSFLPGTIIDIFIKTGEKVKEGETILLLEAMKMQNQVRMPFDGEIVKIYIRKDEVISKNHLMLEIKPKNLK
ncbi:MAG: acetyl-CoA carboxylase biotin carboxyl carrier protein subunit [Prolixibacteraceae bacterium]|jgi:biotin carboxyl carrier protein|nr:acetyl-CoA carboxylase biotin carboxyl carrier protein subunit [Prolixibacteraceae bacterium]MBT6766031.1 acetyl-CoA carboxylase biotin carboxyl carrier protein subunit [Prolixibacteraceae bacterium]MBT6999798.1 acetyl-CoA carboxylase biotin carboxyl carrier protein subunit [Prolixibacteraceae bacterium]MBT7393536.1 acetyl-CoA carboxylase biotin carboxyl carrier protein subunit [Prolixibacteraceae bacterium]